MLSWERLQQQQQQQQQHHHHNNNNKAAISGMPEDNSTALIVVRGRIEPVCYKHAHVKDPTAAEKRSHDKNSEGDLPVRREGCGWGRVGWGGGCLL